MTLRNDLFATLSWRVCIGALAWIMSVAVWTILLLDLRMKLSKLNATIFLISLTSSLLLLTLRLLMQNLALQLFVIFKNLQISLFKWFYLGLGNSHRIINPSYLTLFFINSIKVSILELFLNYFEFCLHCEFKLTFFLLKLFYSLVEDFNMEFELLLNFDMISDFCFILLKLLFVFSGW